MKQLIIAEKPSVAQNIAAALKVNGRKDGYIVFIRKQPAVENGEVAAVNIDGDYTLKRVYKYSDVLLLRAENPDCEDLEYKEGDAENISVLGKAVAFQGDVK